jgi:hypothetical protein
VGGRVLALTLASGCVVLAAVLGSGVTASRAAGPCAGLPRAPAGLPAPVRLSTRCGDVVIRPDGLVERRAGRGDRGGRWPRAALGRNGVRWLMRRDGHLTVERSGEALWRSAGSYRFYGTPHYLEAIALGKRAVAFSFSEAELYVARFGGPERVVAHGEHPILWTRAGRLLTYRWREDTSSLSLHAPNGRLIRRVATGVRTTPSTRVETRSSSSPGTGCSPAQTAKAWSHLRTCAHWDSRRLTCREAA